MKTRLQPALLLVSLFALTALAARANEEQDLIATLKSAATVPEKCTACVKLRVVGTADAIPALAPLLVDEGTAQAARYTLEGMPYPEATAALRQALGRTSGLIKAGLVDSLGWRRDATAVPLLMPLLADADTAVAAAAATALSRIGSREALAALTSARDTAAPAVQEAIQIALLRGADSLLAAGDAKAAAGIYSSLFQPALPEAIRIAAWRGLVMADTGRRAKLVTKALQGEDLPLQQAALKVLRELRDQTVVKACLREWTSLSADGQLAVLDARLKVGDRALPTVRDASRSPHVSVRIAAWTAFGTLGSISAIPVLAKAAATGEPAERDAAREALETMNGRGVSEALRKDVAKAGPAEKAELLRALGNRGDAGVTSVLLQYVSTSPEPVRLAALESLRKLAAADSLLPLLQVAAACKTDAECEPVVAALEAVCRASADKDQATRSLLETLKTSPPAARCRLLPLLAELATPAALQAAEAAAAEPNPDVSKEAVRVLSRWPSAAPAQRLLELAGTATSPALQVLALRGCIAVVGQEPDVARRLAILQQARAAAKRTEEKKQALSQLGLVPTPEALQLVLVDLADSELADEAALAALNVAEKLASAQPQLASDTAVKLLAKATNPGITKRAWALRGKPAAGAFIEDWLVCGPYSKPGVNGAIAVFDVPFGPERPGEKVAWKSLPHGENASLTATFPGAENCAAYLKAQIVAPLACSGALLLGSDDGIKAWLNGVVVFGTNCDRGDLPDQDVAPIELKQGTNELMLKVTQGGGGWSAHARIVGADGQPINGLRVEPPPATPPVERTTAPAGAAKPKRKKAAAAAS